jgi:uncharacterized protein HemY
MRLRQFAEAEECYRGALAFSPILTGPGLYHERGERAFILRSLASVIGEQGRHAEAIKACRDSLALVPNDPKTHESLAGLLANCPDPRVADPREAIRIARRGTDLVPEDGHLWQALGMALYRASEWNEAVRALDQAMALRGGGEATDKLFMAMALWRLGQHEEAKSWFERGCAQMLSHDDPTNGKTGGPAREQYRDEARALLGLADPSKPVH